MSSSSDTAPDPAPDTDTAADPPKDEVAAEVQANVDTETKRGLQGVEVDPTPNEHYTVDGVNAGLPTPETDPAQAAVARDAIRQPDAPPEPQR